MRNNEREIEISTEVINIIENYRGNDFDEKFENLVVEYCKTKVTENITDYCKTSVSNKNILKMYLETVN